jgi:hypothetical protein
MWLVRRQLYFHHSEFESQKAFQPKLCLPIGPIASYALDISLLTSDFLTATENR